MSPVKHVDTEVRPALSPQAEEKGPADEVQGTQAISYRGSKAGWTDNSDTPYVQ
jgi:hypothetical protein